MTGRAVETSNISRRIDATLLRPNATVEEVLGLVGEALRYGYRGVAVAPHYLPMVDGALRGTNIQICGVVGFPLGTTTKAMKLYEVGELSRMGATEIDMVTNIGAYLSGKVEVIVDELTSVVDLARMLDLKAVKVIIETGYLSRGHIEELSRLVADSGADFVKTSTGFGPRGATVEDVLTIKGAVGDRVRIKAAGGIKTLEQALGLIEAGASVIGTSSAKAIVEEAMSSVR